MRVLGAYRSDAGGYYRVAAPFSVLNYSTEHEFRVTQPTVDSAEEYDILWLYQHADPIAEIVAREFKDRGKPVIYDVDDFLFGMPVSWSGYDSFFLRGRATGTERLMFHERLIQMADVVTTTTPVLADCLMKLLGIHEEKVRVLPNCVLQGDWDTVTAATHVKDGPVLGWFGTGNHWDDWSEIAETLDTALEHVGGYLALVGAPEVVMLFPERLAARTSVHPVVPMKKFHDVRRIISAFDVGLAWCTNRLTAHRCRSPLKAIQYGAAGVPVIASDTVYDSLPGWNSQVLGCEMHTYGTTVSVTEYITAALAGIVEKPKEALEKAKAWQKRIWKNHTYETQAYRWLEVAMSVYSERSLLQPHGWVEDSPQS